MDEIPQDHNFNWDQTALSLVPTGEWTMHQAKAAVIPIAHSDEKRQVTAVLAATLRSEFLPPQVISQGKTVKCILKWQSQKGVGHMTQSKSLVK